MLFVIGLFKFMCANLFPRNYRNPKETAVSGISKIQRNFSKSL